MQKSCVFSQICVLHSGIVGLVFIEDANENDVLVNEKINRDYFQQEGATFQYIQTFNYCVMVT